VHVDVEETREAQVAPPLRNLGCVVSRVVL
jgi:hypothetical protein